MDARPFRGEVEAAWRQTVDRARSRYEEMVAFRQKMVVANLRPYADGRLVLHMALQEESAARKEHMRVLRIFINLIRHGTSPEEEPGS